MIKRSPSRSKYGELSGHDAGLTPGKGQREGRRTEKGKHSSEKVWTRLRKSLRERIAFVGVPHCRNRLVLVLHHAQSLAGRCPGRMWLWWEHSGRSEGVEGHVYQLCP